VPQIDLERCEQSGKEPARTWWASLEPGLATCACGGTWTVEEPAGVFPEHGRGQCEPGHCATWTADVQVRLRA